MCGETAQGRLEQRNGRATPRPIHKPAGEPLPRRGNRDVGSREALAQRERRQVNVLFTRQSD